MTFPDPMKTAAKAILGDGRDAASILGDDHCIFDVSKTQIVENGNSLL
jgi:hypothetical protein